MGALSPFTDEAAAIAEDCSVSEMDGDAEADDVDCVDSSGLASRTGESDRNACFQMEEKNSNGSGEDFCCCAFLPGRDATTGVDSRRANSPFRFIAAAADGDMAASDFRRCATVWGDAENDKALSGCPDSGFTNSRQRAS
jgi:hypothetical protein